ncbi:hypothetical protein L202_05001 [Cryptococcus amylolentus CBS 6039]|uniref:Uncharacterized protein n=2 Tax=Cryptococcus amylolentus TaxID=104669 RepID=A0A1E3HNI7_9TREE|nr:hypothetical protein L202_05001 [Cryptococcus amylolentus CBS 6039]ODN77894.1 hypothetical protein L202_05001 [Cryptococcus amylolentus CBS 6039]ODO05865.1 hypothetical protein I350_04926 [Cryptococcus amylolentus CBS 6273]
MDSQTVFSTRNAFYLRVSNYRIIPLFLYLDERHVNWMTDRVLQLVIAGLQSKLPEVLFRAKLEKDKKHKVHVERGEGYQFCYFMRTTSRTEVVLLKNKDVSLRPPTPPPPVLSEHPSSKRKSSTRRSATASATPRGRASRSRSRSVTVRPEEDEPVNEQLEQFTEDSVNVHVKPEPIDPDEEDEYGEAQNIKDWKPDVDVSYRGFGTSSVQLVLIIEPYPPLPPSQYAPPASRLSSRSASVVSNYSRARSSQTRQTRGAASRYSSTSLSLAPQGQDSVGRRSETVANMRNASRAPSVANSQRGGESATPFREDSTTPGPGEAQGRRRMSQTPLFMPRDTPFDEDEEDEEAHEEYLNALRDGRSRLPSVFRPSGETKKGKGKRRRDEEDEDDEDDVPESLENIGARLVRNSEIEEGVVRVQGGWEERSAGEESAVIGREEPGE